MADQATRQRIFRAAALERLSSPEQLDELITVTRPRAWLAMAALWLGLIALVTWSIAGRISTLVTAQGVILGGRVSDVTPAWGGQVRTMLVQTGDTVRRNQVIATVDQPELQVQLRNQEARLRDLRSELRVRKASAERLLSIQRRYVGQQTQNLETSAREQDVVVKSLLARFDGERALLDKGLLSQEAALQTQQSLNTARETLARMRSELVQLGATQMSAETTAEQSLITTEQGVADAERELQRLQQDLTLRSKIVSPATGVVLERSVDAGDMLIVGQAIVKLRVTETGGTGNPPGVRALLYVAGSEGKRVKIGMEIQIAPSSIRSEEFGYMLARVRAVTDQPTSSQALKEALRNDALVSSVAALSSPFQIEAEFVRDSSESSGYRWTSRPGPDTRIDAGTLARALIVVEKRRPIEMVVPALRRLFNLQ